MKRFLILLAVLVNSPALADSEVYGIDNSHTFASFTIRHVVSKTTGTFSDIKGKILIDRSDLSKSSVEAKINMMSVNTNHAKRDTHIRDKAEYLDVGKYTWMDFVSSKVLAMSNDEGIVTGNLTLHGVTREISFPFKVLGFGSDPWGGQRVGFEAHTAIKASDYGFGWASQPNGPVGNDIEITLLIEGVKEVLILKP
ncbi:MAG: polyisoprenoid-binding protein [Methylotenera sp.]|nr:polyisoprenoid-binding protein [Methylotenera sp.]MSP99089.1 polyisoprenoid-binding protein [Methylotenera sp.]